MALRGAGALPTGPTALRLPFSEANSKGASSQGWGRG